MVTEKKMGNVQTSASFDSGRRPSAFDYTGAGQRLIGRTMDWNALDFKRQEGRCKTI
jgi:hypothetical protein